MKAWQIVRRKDNMACDPPYESMLDACKAIDKRQYPALQYLCRRVSLTIGNVFISAKTKSIDVVG